MAHNSCVVWQPNIGRLMIRPIDTGPIRRRRVPVDDKGALDIDLHRARMADGIIYLSRVRACPPVLVVLVFSSIANGLEHCGGCRMGRNRRHCRAVARELPVLSGLGWTFKLESIQDGIYRCYQVAYLILWLIWRPRRIVSVTRRRPFSLPKPSLSIGSYQRGPFGHVPSTRGSL
jgi:hypothetical protein